MLDQPVNPRGIPFQSTPPHGGRPAPSADPGPAKSFNPRPRTGGDPGLPSNPIGPWVSIHAPARGATSSFSRPGTRKKFQSTPPHGGRHDDSVIIAFFKGFQSTPPHGGRLPRAKLPRIGHKFQSTPPHGGRLPLWRTNRFMTLFQSTPPHGGRLPRAKLPRIGHKFQSTPPHGGRLPLWRTNRFMTLFQSTPPHGGRRGIPGGGLIGRFVSIHAPARGATLRGDGLPERSPGFNPRPRTGGD